MRSAGNNVRNVKNEGFRPCGRARDSSGTRRGDGIETASRPGLPAASPENNWTLLETSGELIPEKQKSFSKEVPPP